MRIEELTVEVRDGSLERVGQILPADLVGFKASLRFNNVGSWEIELPANHAMADALRQPSAGIVVTGLAGVLFSGPTTAATNSKTNDNPQGTWKIQGVTDSVILSERLAYPSPAIADVSAQTASNDIRTGQASTVILGYVDDNIGPNAPVEREIPGLAVMTDPLIGSTVYGSARFDVLGELISGLASIDQLGFDIRQTDGSLEFYIYQPVDRSGYIRMDVLNNTLSKAEYAYGNHSLSRAIVAGQGQGTDRQFLEITSTESIEAETVWGRRIETFIDQRNTSDVNELTQAGVEALADGGTTLTSIDVIPANDLTMRFGIDWGLGDRVSVEVGDQEIQAIVTNVAISVESDGVRVGATVGEPTGVDYEALVAKKQVSTAKRINALERKESASGGVAYIHAISALNKGSITGATIPAGTVVMFAGSQGDVIDIAPAVADGTYPEHFLAGVTADDILQDEIGDVIQLGFVDHIDTSDFALGDILYADPATPGGFSLTPGSWGTPIAAVTRVHANTGRLLVRCIPGGSGGGAGSGIVSGATAPENPDADMAWFDTTSGNIFIWYEDGDSGQWVQILGGGTDTLSGRVSTAEANINLLDTRVDALEATDVSLDSRLDAVEPAVTNLKAGWYIRQIEVQVDTAGRTFGGWGLGPTFPTLTYAGGSKIKMMYHIPMRNDAGGWGGIYVEPQIQFNGGTWQSLGTTGHEMMHLGNADIATYKNDILVNPGISTSFTAAFRFYVKAYEGTVGWNNGINHDINVSSGTATIMSGDNGNQHYMHIIIEEFAKA